MLASMLDAFGVDMGKFFDERTSAIMQTRRTYQTFECMEWSNMAATYRNHHPAATLDEIAQLFQSYVARRLQNSPKGVPQGIKQPTVQPLGLSYRLDAIPLTVIHIHRGLEDCFESRRKYEGNDVDDSRDMGIIYTGMRILIQRVPPVLTLEYEDVLRDPETAAESVAKALELPKDKIADAARRVRPNPSMEIA